MCGVRVGKAHASPTRCSSCAPHPPLYWGGWQRCFKKGEEGGKLLSLTGWTPQKTGGRGSQFPKLLGGDGPWPNAGVKEKGAMR